MALSRAKAGWVLAFLVLMWGVNWPLTKYALNFTPPLIFAGMRLLIGGGGAGAVCFSPLQNAETETNLAYLCHICGA